MIEAHDLIKSHGSQTILRGISLQVPSGQAAVIIGPSGGGKSTFLRCLNGLETFHGGWVQIGDDRLPALGTDQKRNRDYQRQLLRIRRRVGMVFQQFHLFPHLSVIENVIEAPRQVLGLSREEARNRATQLLDRVGLADFTERYPDRLSGGQQQRVAIARALAMEPAAMLFDEPTSALDPRMTAEVLAVMADLAGQGLTMVIVTHAMQFARRAANQVYVFHQGRVLESGPPEQIFEAPQQPETAAFLQETALAG